MCNAHPTLFSNRWICNEFVRIKYNTSVRVRTPGIGQRRERIRVINNDRIQLYRLVGSCNHVYNGIDKRKRRIQDNRDLLRSEDFLAVTRAGERTAVKLPVGIAAGSPDCPVGEFEYGEVVSAGQGIDGGVQR